MGGVCEGPDVAGFPIFFLFPRCANRAEAWLDGFPIGVVGATLLFYYVLGGEGGVY